MNRLNQRVAEALEKAADMLESEEVQWLRGDFEVLLDGDTDLMGYCAVGALCKASGETWHLQHPVTTGAVGFIKPHIIESVWEIARHETCNPNLLPSREDWDPESAVIMFNDRIVEDKAGVIEVFKLAAKDVRNQA